jgi:glycine cleavage system H lipoate-binding protein
MDFFATKGIEYLLVIGYLLLLIPFAWLLRRMAVEPTKTAAAPSPASPSPRFPDGVYFHRGHTWAAPEGGNLVRVGIDDFAQRLMGPPTEFSLPSPGQHLVQGENGWQARVDGHTVDLLSPVQGEVVEVNHEVIGTPQLVCEAPYGRGWLLKIRVANAATALKNLLSPRLANVWMDEAHEELGILMQGDLGPVLQDGGLPVPGFAAQLAGDRWPEIAKRFFLTD